MHLKIQISYSCTIKTLLCIGLFLLFGWQSSGQYDEAAYNFRSIVKNDKSLWPADLKNKKGKARIPTKIEKEEVYFSNENGFPAFGYLSFDDFLDYVIGYMKKLTDYELHITYKNLAVYHQHFPKEILVRMTHQPFINNKKFPVKYQVLRLKVGEKLFFSKIDKDGKVHLTNNRLQSKGIASIPLDLYYTNLLYETRRIVRRELNEASAEYLHPLILKKYDKHTLTVYEVNEDLSEQKASLNSHTDKLSSFTRHSKRPVDSMNAVFPLPIEIKSSEWEGYIDKVFFKTNFHFFSQTYAVQPDIPAEGLFVMTFKGDKWKRQSMGWVEKIIPHDWDNFIDFTDDWEIIDYNSNIQGKFYKQPGNVLHFFAKNVVELPEIEVRLKKAKPIKEVASNQELPTSSFTLPQKKITKITTLQDLDDGFTRRYHTNNPEEPFMIWDGMKEDGDMISILLNGIPIYNKIGVVNKKTALKFKLKKGENILEIRAENEGQYIPNTAMFQYGNDIIELQSKTGQSKKMKIYYEE